MLCSYDIGQVHVETFEPRFSVCSEIAGCNAKLWRVQVGVQVIQCWMRNTCIPHPLDSHPLGMFVVSVCDLRLMKPSNL